MMKRLLALFLASALSAIATAQNLPLSSLPAATALGGTELLYGVQGGASKKVTPLQIKTYAVPLTTKGDLFGFSTLGARVPIGTDGQVLTADSTQTLGLKWAGGSAGTVTTFSCVTANGVSCSVADATTTPAATFTLGAITPTTVNGLALSLGGGSVADNVALGLGALFQNVTGSKNTALGYGALYYSTGNFNVGVGWQAANTNTSGAENVAVGQSALFTNATGGKNVAVGSIALNATTAGENVAVGYAALYSNSSGANNTALGLQAGYGAGTGANTTGSNNLYLGYKTVGSAAGNSNEIVIGANAVGLGTNNTVLGNSNTTAAKIWGALTVSGGITAPGAIGGGTPAAGTFTTLADAKGDVRDIPQNSQSTAYTTVLSDCGKHLYHPTADTTARTYTIDSNANVAAPVGCAITIANDLSAGVITVAITSDTMRLAGTTSTGSRTMTGVCLATALKVATTVWIISGGSCLT